MTAVFARSRENPFESPWDREAEIAEEVAKAQRWRDLCATLEAFVENNEVWWIGGYDNRAILGILRDWTETADPDVARRARERESEDVE